MRLAFSIAVHVNPEILLIDEILAVGDTEFQQKCFKKMEEFKKSKEVTIIFVSHNLTQVKKFCSRVIYINNHKIKIDNTPIKSLSQYKSDQNK